MRTTTQTWNTTQNTCLASEAGQSPTGVVTALIMCAATPLELAEESRFLVPVSLRVAEFLCRFGTCCCGQIRARL